MPIAEHVFAKPNDGSHVAIATRFGGLYTTADAGVTFRNVCHEAIGSDDSDAYPGVFTAGGTVAVSTGFRGVSTSQDGCDWGQWTPEGVGLIGSIATFGTDGLLALKAEPALPSNTEVWTSTDAGTTWTTAGDPLPLDVIADSVYSSSDGTRWFVGARSATGAKLMRSEDGGRTWSTFTFPSGSRVVSRLVGMTAPPLERLVAILSEDHIEGVEPSQGDVVLLSEDAGATWTTLFSAEHAIRGAAINEDGVLFFGNPVEGLYRFALSDVGDAAPLRISMTPTRGLAAAGGRVYSIGDELTDGYTVAVSSDEGRTFVPFFALCKTSITGACSADSSVATSCSFGIETEPWQPLGAACASKSAPAEPVATPEPVMVAPKPARSSPKNGCGVGVRAEASGRLARFIVLVGVASVVRRRRRRAHLA